jgi:predicted nucleic acid-binding protein
MTRGFTLMRKLKIYLETTLFNYYFDIDRDAHADTVKLFEEIRAGKYEAYTSAYVIDELGETKEESKRSNMLALIGEYNINVLDTSDEAQDLADIYINEGVIPASKRLDSLHISVATVNDLEYIFSFNFQHINRIKTKTMTNLINTREGYKPITITVPSEVIEYGKSE